MGKAHKNQAKKGQRKKYLVCPRSQVIFQEMTMQPIYRRIMPHIPPVSRSAGPPWRSRWRTLVARATLTPPSASRARRRSRRRCGSRQDQFPGMKPVIVHVHFEFEFNTGSCKNECLNAQVHMYINYSS